MTEVIIISDWLSRAEQTAGKTRFEGEVVEEKKKAIKLETRVRSKEQTWWVPKSQILERFEKPPGVKPIEEITPDDGDIRIVCTVMEVGEDRMRVKDGSGEIPVFGRPRPDWVEEETKADIMGVPRVVDGTLELHQLEVKKWPEVGSFRGDTSGRG